MNTIVITGSGRRLGLYLTKKFCEKGFKVFAITRKITSELKLLSFDNLIIVEVNEYDKDGAEYAISKIKENVSKVDILVNNASLFIKDEKSNPRSSDFEMFFKVHMLFPFELSTGISDIICSQDYLGVIVNITDIYSENPNPDYLLYCSTKAGLENLNAGLAKKYAGLIRVCAIAPGPIKFLPEHTNFERNKVLKQTLIAKEGGFISVLKTIDFIIDNDYLTGITIKVDGGRSICNR